MFIKRLAKAAMYSLIHNPLSLSPVSAYTPGVHPEVEISHKIQLRARCTQTWFKARILYKEDRKALRYAVVSISYNGVVLFKYGIRYSFSKQ